MIESAEKFLEKSVIFQKLSLQDQLNELQKRILALERDLEQSRTAHAREKQARQELEEEKEKMNSTLKQMEENFHVLASYVNQRKDVFAKNFQIPMTQNEVLRRDLICTVAS